MHEVGSNHLRGKEDQTEIRSSNLNQSEKKPGVGRFVEIIHSAIKGFLDTPVRAVHDSDDDPHLF